MKATLLCALLLLATLYNVDATLYGIVTDFSGNDSQTVVYTVQVDPTTGNFTRIAENLVYVGSSATYDGIATFDQQKNYLYFSSDFEASFVYGVDITKGELLPPVSINSDSVNSIEWDGTNQQLLILGVFHDGSSAVYTFPYSGESIQLINFTAVGISTPLTTYLDWAKGIYYLVYPNATSSQYNLASFPISNPKAIKGTPLQCPGLSPDYLFLDSSSGNLFGVGYYSTASGFRYFTIQGSTCKIVDVGLTGIITAATYDPTSHSLHLGYVGEKSPALVTLDITSQKVTSQIPTLRVLEDLQVSYKV